jgi:predicted regulator of Ras-like GTPase activity (Roadblock/LC7/MglB family)
VDALGGSLASTVNGVEEMGQELAVDAFEDLFIQYGKAVIVCRPLGDSIVAMLAPDASKLGIIRHKIKKPLEDLARFV